MSLNFLLAAWKLFPVINELQVTQACKVKTLQPSEFHPVKISRVSCKWPDEDEERVIKDTLGKRFEALSRVARGVVLALARLA